MSRLFPFVLAFLLLAVLAISLVVAPAQARTRDTEQVLYEILQERGSPLAEEVYTTVAFRRYHGPSFNLINFYALLWAESSLGKGSQSSPGYRHHNVGSIRGGPVGSLWRDLRTGTFSSGFNHYPSYRAGQRAAILLVWTHYGGNIRTGLHRYYGIGVNGWYGYHRNFEAARQILLREGRKHGLNPVHLH